MLLTPTSNQDVVASFASQEARGHSHMMLLRFCLFSMRLPLGDGPGFELCVQVCWLEACACGMFFGSGATFVSSIFIYC